MELWEPRLAGEKPREGLGGENSSFGEWTEGPGPAFWGGPGREQAQAPGSGGRDSRLHLWCLRIGGAHSGAES